ncbi:LLM class flavin-dependent oxidoreductase [Arthrobacter sp. CAU 1506]|nr:LLM class flavin-dependent oxidoreductase [Arthrobacter sp. CAU 1506]
MTREIRLFAFEQNCVMAEAPGLWRHPECRSMDYTSLEYWTSLAKTLERGMFDGLFIADVLGLYEVYESSRNPAIREAAQVPENDPSLLVSAMAGVTEHLGFGITASVAFEHPYPFARRMSTLDHLTNGRSGWNVVTSYNESGLRNLGFASQMTHANRYDLAEEYLEVCYKLWEGSWEDGAVLRDQERGVYADPSRVHDIDHVGKIFTVPGMHLSEPSPQRSPIIFQAGSSSRGKAFASQNAEAIFTAAPTKEVLRATVSDIRRLLVEAGREPDSAVIFNQMTVITDETSEGAKAKYEDYLKYVSLEGSMVLMSQWLGTDFSKYDLSQPLDENANRDISITSAIDAFMASKPEGESWTIGDIVQWGAIGGLGPVVVGSAQEVADQMQEWVEESGVDGFCLSRAIAHKTHEDVVDYVIPELQRRGVYKTKYREGTLREKLFNKGPHLPADHRAANFRVESPVIG